MLDADPDNEIIQSLLASLSSSKQEAPPPKVRNDSVWLKHYLQGDQYYKEKRFKEAKEELKKAMRLNPNDSRVYFLSGVISRELNDTEGMLEAWQRARELNPSDSMINELVGYAEGNLDKEKDIAKLTDSIKENPDDWKIRIELVNVYLTTGRKKYYSYAIQQLEEVIRVRPDYNLSYKLLASAYEKMEDYKQAVVYYEKYIQNGGAEKWVKGRIAALKKYQRLIDRSKEVFSEKGAEDKIVLIPGGEFIRGAPYREGGGGIDEDPPSRVYLPDFYIDQYEVTHRQYKRFIDATGYKSPVYWKERKYPSGKDIFPVSYVSWYDAVSYCNWAGKRLPTESEWEKAARGTDGRRYPWGEKFENAYANTGSSALYMLTPADSYPSGVSPYGVFDMAGNVQEWTADWYKAYPGSTLQRNSFGEIYKVVRGGSFLSDPLENARTSARSARLPTKIHRTIGFRCAL